MPKGYEDLVTIEGFLKLLWQEFQESLGQNAEGERDGAYAQRLWNVPELALRHGWAEPGDLRHGAETLHRNEAARILHEFLKRELGEADERDVSPATRIKDIYDCRTCVSHVAQVFCKGIMEAPKFVFGMRKEMTQGEAGEAVQRAIRKEKRLMTVQDSQDEESLVSAKPARLSREQAQALIQKQEELLCIDVRTAGEYGAWHPEGFENFPLIRLLEDPEKVSIDKGRPILLGCDGGYRSEIAAMALAKAGYEAVSHYGWDFAGGYDES